MWKLIKNCDAIIFGIIGLGIMLSGLIWGLNQYSYISQSIGFNEFLSRSYNQIGLIIFGFFFVFISWLNIRLDIMNPLRREQLERTGRRIEATIKKIRVTAWDNTKKWQVNAVNQAKWRIDLEFKENDRIYHFTSQSINFDPKKILKRFDINKIPIWVDIQNMKKYYVDLDQIQKLKGS